MSGNEPTHEAARSLARTGTVDARMIKIAITAAAFEAIAATLPLGSVAYEPEVNAKGERLVWLAPAVVDRLTGMRGPGESFLDVVLRLVGMEAST